MAGFYVQLKQEIVRVRTLGGFVADNPFTMVRQEDWSLELCRIIIPNVPMQMRLQDKQLQISPSSEVDAAQRLMIRSNSDGKTYTLPQSLAAYVISGKVRLSDVPVLLCRVGYERKHTFSSSSANKVLMSIGGVFILLGIALSAFLVVLSMRSQVGGVGLGGVFTCLGIISGPGVVFFWKGRSLLKKHRAQGAIIEDWIRAQGGGRLR